MKKNILAFSALYIAGLLSYGQSGSLDNTFGTGGIVSTGVGITNDAAYAVAIQSDGKIVVGGYTNTGGFDYDFAAVRYNTDGSLDTTFGTGGKVLTDFFSGDDRAVALAIQSDGKIVLAGTCHNGVVPHFAVVRYTSSGTLDNSFDTDGKVTTDFGGGGDNANAIVVQSDGKIVVAGSSNGATHADFAVARYNTDGSLDALFDGDGLMTMDFGSTYDYAYGLAIQSDGKIMVTGASTNAFGSDFALIRCNTDGSLDITFDTDGKVITDLGSTYDESRGLVIQSDGKIVSAGIGNNGSDDDFALVRYNSDGSLDTGFDTDGQLLTPIGTTDDACWAVALQSDGKIITFGTSFNGSGSDFALVRYNSDGSLDNTFDTDGKVTTDLGNNNNDEGYSVAMQTDGKIVGAGSTIASNNDFAVARYNNASTGIKEIYSNAAGTIEIYPNPSSGTYTVALESKTSAVKINVCDVLGNSVWKKDYRDGLHFKVDLGDLPKGIYFMEILDHEKRTLRKIFLE